MAENQPTAPQFIRWVKEAGVFRPAQLRMPEDYAGYNLDRNTEFIGEQIFCFDQLHLISSVGLGPVTIFEISQELESHKELFERFRRFCYGNVNGIVELARKVAEEKGVPYFGVDIVKTNKDRIWKFEARPQYDFHSVKQFKNLDFLSSIKSTEPIEFVLHPTAQLYVPRK